MKNLLLTCILSLPILGWTQNQQELKLGMVLNSTYALNYEYIPQNKHSFFINLNVFPQPQSISKRDSIAGQSLDLGELAFEEPHLGIKVGRIVYESTDTISGFAWGYYLSTRFRIAQSKAFIREFNKKFGINPQFRSYYGAIGTTVQYRWFIKQKWSITFTIFADAGIEKRFADHLNPNSRASNPPAIQIFELSPVLFVGYRF